MNLTHSLACIIHKQLLTIILILCSVVLYRYTRTCITQRVDLTTLTYIEFECPKVREGKALDVFDIFARLATHYDAQVFKFVDSCAD
jgi:hypothetical protein